MKTLWTFGDSYTQIFNPLNNQYLNQVARTLNLNHNPYGRTGCSISYISYTFNQVRNKIKDNDIVVIALTAPTRRWFYVIEDINNYVPLTDNQLQAEDMYRRYLDNDLESNNILLDFLYNVHYLTEQKNLHTIIMPCFDSSQEMLDDKNFPLFHIADGTLYDISKHELTDNFYKEWTKNGQMLGNQDPRFNHMIISNHNILADRIVNNIQYNTDIDLKNGFVCDAIDFNSEYDLKQRTYELVNDSFWFF